MTSNRVKTAARTLQAAEGIPYAEARRRVLAGGPPAPRPPVSRPTTQRPHRHLGSLYMGGLGETREEFCYRCATPELRERVAAVDQAARSLRIVAPAPDATFGWHDLQWPYGPNIDLEVREELVAWAGPLDLRQSKASNRCLHWLRGKQCPRDASYQACGATVPGADHLSAWNQGPGRTPAVLVSQPYKLSNESRAALAQLAQAQDLVVEVDDAGGWYGMGTIWVAIWRADRRRTPATR